MALTVYRDIKLGTLHISSTYIYIVKYLLVMCIYLFAGSLYNCSDHRAIVTDSYWTVLCPPTEEIALQTLSLINDELPILSPSKEIGIIMEPVCAYCINMIMFSISDK